MSGTIEVLLKSKAVIGPYENSRQSLLIMSLMRMFIASFRIHDKKGGEDKARRTRRRTQAG